MTKALRSRGAEITLSGMRILLGVLFLTVWGSNLHKGLYGPDSYAGVIRDYADGGEAPVFPAVVALAVAFVPEARRWSLDARRHR